MALTIEDQITSLKQGDHVCMIYEGAEDQLAAAVPFVRDGLDRDEVCVYIADDRTIADVSTALRAAGIDVEAETATSRLHLLTRRDSYLKEGGFDPDRMVEALGRYVERAVADGHAGFRVTGEMTWALCDGCGCDRLIEYEAKLNRFFPRSRALAICQYNRRRFDARVIHDVLRTHPVAILGRNVCPNVYYEPPEMVLADAGEERRVAWMIEQLSRAREAEIALQQMNAEREQFAYVASHDLQEPLRMIRVYLQLAQRSCGDALDPRSHGYMGRVHAAAERMSALIDGILTYSRTDDRGSVEEVPLGRVARQAVEELRASIDSTGAEVAIGELPTVRCDPPMMKRVFANLIGNALKFRRGPPHVRITARQHGHEHVIAIEDDGIGIDPEDVHLLFRIFKRLTPRDAYPGHGIGLATVRKIVELHHGRVWVESRPGAGSTFSFALPR